MTVRAIIRTPWVRLGGLLLAAGLSAVGLVVALAIAGQPFTALAAGACLGTAVTAMVEAAARLPGGRWLADHGTSTSPIQVSQRARPTGR